MNSLFKLSELHEKPIAIKKDDSKVCVVKYLNKHITKVESIKQLLGKYPDKGEIFFLWTLNSFNAFTFIVYIIKHVGVIEELTISTYSINERILTSLIKWYDKGEILKVNISISDSIKHRSPRIYDAIQSQIKNRAITVNYTWNHSKVTALKTKDHFFVVEGSGNYSENAQFEQYIFMNDKMVYDFRVQCICPSKTI